MMTRRGRTWGRWLRPVTQRQRRLCERSGHRWSLWSFYCGAVVVIVGEGGDYFEKGRSRSCLRCRETQYLHVEMDYHVRRSTPILSWSGDADAWKGEP